MCEIEKTLYIILNQYKNGNISEEEIIQIIEDLYKGKTTYVPIYPYYTPQITYEYPPQFQKFEVTCKQ